MQRAFLTLGFLGACASAFREPASDIPTLPKEELVRRLLAPTPQRAVLVSAVPLRSESPRCAMTRVTLASVDPVDGREARIVFDHYVAASGSGEGRTVLILPPTGGENILDRFYARAACGRGLNAVLAKTWSHDVETGLPYEIHDNGFLRGVVAIRHILDFVPGRFSVIGTSVGALYEGLAFGVEDRLESAVFVVGGGGLPHILAHSDETGVRKLREARLRAFGIPSVEAYEKILDANIALDLMKFLPPAKPKPVLMVTALQDSTVPTASQLALWEKLGRPARIDIKSNHPVAILTSWFSHKTAILDFMEEHLRSGTKSP